METCGILAVIISVTCGKFFFFDKFFQNHDFKPLKKPQGIQVFSCTKVAVWTFTVFQFVMV